VLPRFPVRSGPGLAGFAAIVAQRPGVLARLQLRYALTHTTRALLGTRAYGRLRGLWVARAGERA
jgi:hypothetical protein